MPDAAHAAAGAPAQTDLEQLFRRELELCAIRPRETVVVCTDPAFAYPEYAAVAVEAATAAGAAARLVGIETSEDLESEDVSAAWRAASLVLGATSVPWVRSVTNAEALAAGARTLMVAEGPESLRRLFPHPDVIRRTYSGARRMQRAQVMRITDADGTDLTMTKGDRKVNAQCGVADRPGRWDHWPSAMVDSTPYEDSAEGTLVVRPGDVFFRMHVDQALTITIRAGRITDIDGGAEAAALREHLESYDDPEAYRLSHVGWGTDHRAAWGYLAPDRPPTWPCPDQEGLLGGITVALGMNACAFPDEFSGIDGVNTTAAHFDISMRAKSFFLDGECVIDRETIASDELR